jgi:ketosteroid isomerase-like protein
VCVVYIELDTAGLDAAQALCIPKVAGSNPAPATRRTSEMRGFFTFSGFCVFWRQQSFSRQCEASADGRCHAISEGVALALRDTARAMSQENVEFIRESIQRFVVGDFEGLREDYSPDAVLYAPRGWPDGAVFEGREAVLRQFARVQEDWQRQEMDPSRIEDHDDWVITQIEWEASGTGSGISTEMTVVGAYRVDAGKIMEVRFFWDWSEALEAAGLSK